MQRCLQKVSVINMDIKIFKKNHTFYFLKNNYLVAKILEISNNLIFYEYHFEKINIKQIDSIKAYEIELYEFLFSDNVNRLFLDRTKSIQYRGNMQKALKIDKELKEYFQNIIENE